MGSWKEVTAGVWVWVVVWACATDVRAWAAEERACEAADVGTFPGAERPGFVPRAACHMLPMYGQLNVEPDKSMSLWKEDQY